MLGRCKSTGCLLWVQFRRLKHADPRLVEFQSLVNDLNKCPTAAAAGAGRAGIAVIANGDGSAGDLV